MIERIASISVDPALLQFRDNATLDAHLDFLPDADVTRIGASREGQDLFGVRVGRGERAVSVIAGSHADEPVGPMTAQALPQILRESFPELLERYTFHIVPQMNPDGADRNRAWFSAPLELGGYLEHAVRELPGDDIEFGFGEGPDVRPECRAMQDFLAPAAPFVSHTSLHGMAFAEGVWCLIGADWAERAHALMDQVSALSARLDLPEHDVDRKGEKGFNRLRKGFSTTPNSVAMKEFFLERGDEATAALFMPSSMEWVRAQGGDPLCIVSELPLFLVGKQSPTLKYPKNPPLRDDLAKIRAVPPDARAEALDRLVTDYAIRPVPLETQLRMQVDMIVLGLLHAEAAGSEPA